MRFIATERTFLAWMLRAVFIKCCVALVWLAALSVTHVPRPPFFGVVVIASGLVGATFLPKAVGSLRSAQRQDH
ncbi:MAG: hypothetical protein JST30_12185 [Armatimonadetes bacterium]|nr:hypothetical protein [Armatimonadota bacterium]